jgi:putative NADH-flavin reductase
MKLLVFGATSGTGRQIVAQALEQGHVVTAFVRHSAAVTTKHENLIVKEGDVLDYPSVAAAVKGQDAVLSALTKTTVLLPGTKNIIHAMEQHGVGRFVCESSLGVADSRKQLGWLFRFFVVPLLLRNVFRDREVQEHYIKESKLDWVIVRSSVLTNGRPTGVYRCGFRRTHHPIMATISRADAANFMLKQVVDNTYLRMTPGLWY